MSLIAGAGLDPNKYFSRGNAKPQGSSFDLTIGTIYDHDGNEVQGPFRLEPGEMVQVVSAEVFNLPDHVTGHVTYKTTLTKDGIWALTVGIVDPGWDGPVTTTLLNFSKVQYVLARGAAFLRVSLFDHVSVEPSSLRKCPSLKGYELSAQERAMARFSPTFMNQEDIAAKAGDHVLEKIRTQALAWVGLIAGIFGVVALVFNIAQFVLNGWVHGSMLHSTDIDLMSAKVEQLEERITKLELAREVDSAETKQRPSSASGVLLPPTINLLPGKPK